MLLALLLAAGISACAIPEARKAEEERQQAVIRRMDMAQISVSTGNEPTGKPYTVLGELSYTEPFTPDAIDAEQIKGKLKEMAYERWPDTINAIVKENQHVSSDGSQVTVTAEAIQYENFVDRKELHKEWPDLYSK